MAQQPKAERLQSVRLDSLLGIASIALAITLDWQAADAIWSLWLSSIAIGYATILLVCYSLFFSTGKQDIHALGSIANKIQAIFMVAFFTVHFLGFHLIHGIFLNFLTPFDETFRDAFKNTDMKLDSILHFAQSYFSALFFNYWPFVVLALVSKRNDLKTAWQGKGSVTQPYGMVVKLHCLIFIIAGFYIAGLSEYILYPVLFLFFLPFDSLYEWYVYRRYPDRV